MVPEICCLGNMSAQKKIFGGATPEPPRGGLRPPSYPPARPAQALRHYYSCKEYNTYPTLGSHSPGLIHRHIHSIDLLSHSLTHESHMEFLINSAAQRRLIHHLHFCSHDDAPNTLGFHTFTLCLARGTSNSTDLLSHCFTHENHMDFFSNLCKE